MKDKSDKVLKEYIKVFINFNSKNKQPNLKMGKKFNRYFIKEYLHMYKIVQ